MGEYIFDPAEIGVKKYLESVQPFPVFGNVPKPPPNEPLPADFVEITVTGGSEGVVSQTPMVTFLCWGESRSAAARLAARIKAHMAACRQLDGLPVYRVKTIGLPVFRPDPDTNRPRYQFTLEIHVRGRNFSPSP